MEDITQTTNFAKHLLNVKSTTTDSFIDTDKDLDENYIKILSEYLNEKILRSQEIGSRKLYILFTEPHTFQVSTISTKGSKEVIFDLYIIQSSTKLHLVVASKLNIYEVLEREPYHETLGEYSFQEQLAKALGLMNALAYDVSRNYQLNGEVVANENLELMYCSNDAMSFLIYSL